MTRFVTEDAGQLAVGLQLIVEGAGDEDLPTWQREGVDGFRVG